jgi:hypothetical protein
MNIRRVLSCLAAFCAAAVVSGCGGGDNSSSTTSASPTATTEAQRETASLPLAQAAPIPSGLKCSGDGVVWVNLKSKGYHLSADPYFGRTKNGKYMCKADADAAGYHAAGSRRRHSPEPAATASGY